MANLLHIVSLGSPKAMHHIDNQSQAVVFNVPAHPSGDTLMGFT
jgi:hypothetical protein